MTTCFISYARADEDWMEILAYVLEREGYSPWIDTEGILGGLDFQEVINQALHDADFCIVLLTENAVKSDAIKEEIALALQSKKPIMPLRWDSISRDQIDTLGIGHIQYVDIYRLKFRVGMKRFIESLQKYKHVDASLKDLQVPTLPPPPALKTNETEASENEAGKYARLVASLNSVEKSQDRITLGYSEIEGILGAKLPPSARDYREWWANDATRHSQSKAWLDGGWRVAGINMTNEQVTFVRLPQSELAYINFFSTLLSRLREKKFPLSKHSPNGSSWHSLATFPRGGSQLASYSGAFTAKHQFRFELYIDIGDVKRNKTAFEVIQQQEQALQQKMGTNLPIIFEELPDKRASRIAVYYPKLISIRNAANELNLLTDWAVDAAPIFYNAIADITDQALNDAMRS